jgi:putative ATPase
MIVNALENDIYLKKFNITIAEDEALLRIAGGDARKLYNALELTVSLEAGDSNEGSEIVITDEKVLGHVQRNLAMYDKNGEMHYDIISAFIKSVRGSDPNAALYYLARSNSLHEGLSFLQQKTSASQIPMPLCLLNRPSTR